MRSQDTHGKCWRTDRQTEGWTDGQTNKRKETCTPKLPMLKQVRQKVFYTAFWGSNPDPCSSQNHVTMSRVIKRFRCTCEFSINVNMLLWKHLCLNNIHKKTSGIIFKTFIPRNKLEITKLQAKIKQFKELLIFKVISQQPINEPHHEKTCFCHMRTTKAHISLCIRTVWSAPLLFTA